MRFALWGAAALLATGPVLAESGDGHELGQVTVTASGTRSSWRTRRPRSA